MQMEKGKLSIQAENILPVIKKWLYSEKEIFIRELVSNAFDAITKLRKVSLTEEVFESEAMDFEIRIDLDQEKREIRISDNGIGMTREEIEKYIAQIAFSGAEEFVKRYEESGDKSASGIIGNFGLGFYSSFMVSDRVTVESRSYKPDTKSARWTSDGGEEYEIGEGERGSRGTTITLHLDSESDELLEQATITGYVKRFMEFLSVPILINGEKINNQKPIWTQAPSSLKKEEYIEFYKHMYPGQGDPLFYIHLNVDHPFRLQGILYFPRLAHEMDLTKSSVKIYCKQVFVSDEAQELIPRFLTALQGVLDMPDLPLNVSRSYVQKDPQIRKIAGHIIKKVADRLREEKEKNRENYEEIWDEIAPFVKYGLISDDRFYEQAADTVIYEVVSDDETQEKSVYVSLEDYETENREKADGKIYYVNDPGTQRGPLHLLAEQGIQVLHLGSMIDSHFIQHLEAKGENRRFVRVDGEVSESLLEKKDEEIKDASDQTKSDRLKEIFEKAIGDGSVTIRVESLKSEKLPAMIMFPEHIRRMGEMMAHMGQSQDLFGSAHTLLVNQKNPLVAKILGSGLLGADGSEASSEKSEKLARHIYRLARLAQGGLKGKDLEDYVRDTHDLLLELS